VNQTLKTRRRLRPDDRRAQLLEAAIICYARMGVERAGHGDIAKLTGVSTPTVFNYFSNRDALTQAVLDHVKSEILKIFETVVGTPAPKKTGRAHLLLLAGNLDTLVDTQPDLIKVWLNWSVSFGKNVRPIYLNFQNQLLDKLHFAVEGLKPSGRAGERAKSRIIMGAAQTYIMMKLDDTDTDTLIKFIESVTQIIPE